MAFLCWFICVLVSGKHDFKVDKSKGCVKWCDIEEESFSLSVLGSTSGGESKHDCKPWHTIVAINISIYTYDK